MQRSDHNISDESDCDGDIDAIMDEPDDPENDDDIDILTYLENFFDNKDETGPRSEKELQK